MITWDLTTIDWTAIGSIVTFIALIATFAALFFSNRQEKKNRQLQVLLLRQEQQQKRLDEMIENILEMLSDIDPMHLTNYSKKILEKDVAIEDRYQVDNILRKDQYNYNKLQLQVIRLENYTAAQPILQHLNEIRYDYSIWCKSVAMILYYFLDKDFEYDERFEIIASAYKDMTKRCFEIAPHRRSYLESRKNPFKDSFIDEYINVLTVFSLELTQTLLNEKKLLTNELKIFVRNEQKRIDNVVNSNK